VPLHILASQLHKRSGTTVEYYKAPSCESSGNLRGIDVLLSGPTRRSGHYSRGLHHSRWSAGSFNGDEMRAVSGINVMGVRCRQFEPHRFPSSAG
jgi:hypothetical protein